MFIEHLKRVCRLATPGPWAIRFEDPGSQYASAWVDEGKEMTFEDCNFIDCARTAIPQLVGKIETLFDAIKHGDAEHQAWLKTKIDEHFNIQVTDVY